MVQSVRAIFGNFFSTLPLEGWTGWNVRSQSRVIASKSAETTTTEFSQDTLYLALTRQGKAQWTEADLDRLMQQLGEAGYGWLTREGVRAKLDEINNIGNG